MAKLWTVSFWFPVWGHWAFWSYARSREDAEQEALSVGAAFDCPTRVCESEHDTR